jgi:hypothetical protein
MQQLCIRLPGDRDFEGDIWLENADHQIVLGPFPISGRAADSISIEHKNATRDPLLPYGDPPTGTYKIAGIRETGRASRLRQDLYGRSGAIVLVPWSGDAALADATGRFEILIHGGAPGVNGSLRMGSGHFRVSDATMGALRTHFEAAGLPLWAICEESEADAMAAAGTSANARVLPAWTVCQPAVASSRQALAVTAGEYGPGGDAAIGDGFVMVHPEADAPSIVAQAGDWLVEAA